MLVKDDKESRVLGSAEVADPGDVCEGGSSGTLLTESEFSLGGDNGDEARADERD